MSGRTAEVLGKFRQLSLQSVEFVRDIRGGVGSQVSGDPVQTARENLEVARTVFGKWSMELLIALYANRQVRFEDLRRLLPGISPRVLSQKLKALEGRGLVDRTVLDGHPPRVHYSLTEDGVTVAHLGEPVFLFLRLRNGARAPANSASD